MQEDAILVQQTLAGDEQAFHRLIIKYYATIYALILSWVKNPEDAKDLAQEVYLKAYQELGSLRHFDQFRLWLRQIAKNLCQDWQRKKHDVFVPIDENMICETPLADETLILRETLAKVMKAIDELPESESQLLKERYLDDASYDDLEAKHGLSYNAIAMRLHRAKQHVREKMKSLSGLWILSWQDLAKKIFVGGVETMKIGIKTKLIVAGIAIIVVSGGTGVYIWHSHQSAAELSETSISQIAQNIPQRSSAKAMDSKNTKDVIADKAVKQEIVKSKNDEANKVKTNEQVNSTVKASAGLTQTDQHEETLAEKYDRIFNSPEYREKTSRALEPFIRDIMKYLQESEKLKQERQQLEDKLANASREERDQIQKELDGVKSKYREARINHSEYTMMSIDALDKVALEYFTVDELDEVFRQKSAQVTPEQAAEAASQPGMTEEEKEFASEAKKRLQNKGFVPNQWTAKHLSWL